MAYTNITAHPNPAIFAGINDQWEKEHARKVKCTDTDQGDGDAYQLADGTIVGFVLITPNAAQAAANTAAQAAVTAEQTRIATSINRCNIIANKAATAARTNTGFITNREVNEFIARIWFLARADAE